MQLSEPYFLMTIEEISGDQRGAIKIGPFGSQLKKEELQKKSGFKVYGQENVIANDFSLGDRYLNPSKFNTLRSCQLFPGDLVLTMMGTIGRCTIFPNDAETGIMDSHLLRIQVNPEIVHPSYAVIAMSSEEIVGKQILQMSHGSIMSGLSSRIVRRLRLPIPTLKEQEHIVDVLSAADSTIQQTEALIAKLKQVKAGLLHDLLTYGLDENGQLRNPVAHPEQFKEVAGWRGRVPKEWNYVPLMSVYKTPIRDFGSFSMTNLISFLDSGIPFIKSEMIEEGELKIDNMFYISEQVHQLLHKSWVYPGNVLYSKIGSALGKALVYDGRFGICNSNAAVAKIDVDEQIASNTFIAYVLNASVTREQIKKRIVSLLPRLNLTDISSHGIALPPLSEQRKIVSILQAHDTRIQTEEVYLDKLRAIKQGLMHDLLTGKVRVYTHRGHKVTF